MSDPDDQTPPLHGDGLARLMVDLHDQLFRQDWLDGKVLFIGSMSSDHEYTISREPFASDDEYLTQETLDRLKLKLSPSVKPWKFEYVWPEKIHDYDWPPAPYLPPLTSIK